MNWDCQFSISPSKYLHWGLFLTIISYAYWSAIFEGNWSRNTRQSVVKIYLINRWLGYFWRALVLWYSRQGASCFDLMEHVSLADLRKSNFRQVIFLLLYFIGDKEINFIWIHPSKQVCAYFQIAPLFRSSHEDELLCFCWCSNSVIPATYNPTSYKGSSWPAYTCFKVLIFTEYAIPYRRNLVVTENCSSLVYTHVGITFFVPIFTEHFFHYKCTHVGHSTTPISV